MGNRSTDPWSQNLKALDPSSDGWPAFMRVFPILDWSYGDVWNFLRELDLIYCNLYDQGFTSLGEKNNTCPNPNLKVTGDDGTISFLPAFAL